MGCWDIIFTYEHTNNPQKVILHTNTYRKAQGLSKEWNICSRFFYHSLSLQRGPVPRSYTGVQPSYQWQKHFSSDFLKLLVKQWFLMKFGDVIEAARRSYKSRTKRILKLRDHSHNLNSPKIATLNKLCAQAHLHVVSTNHSASDTVADVFGLHFPQSLQNLP